MRFFIDVFFVLFYLFKYFNIFKVIRNSKEYSWWSDIPICLKRIVYERGRSFFSLYKASNDTLATLTTWKEKE